MSAIALARGEIVTDRTLGVPQKYMVLGPCDHRVLGYLCDSHDVHLANAGNLAIHLTEDAPKLAGECRVAAWCGNCRVYREVNQAQLDALTGQTTMEVSHERR